MQSRMGRISSIHPRRENMRNRFQLVFCLVTALCVQFTTGTAAAQTCTPYTGSSGASFTWSGVTWNIDPNGSGIGSGQVKSLGSNITVDSNCYLHETITSSGTGAEMFSNNTMGFGTYQWVLQGTNYYNM